MFCTLVAKLFDRPSYIASDYRQAAYYHRVVHGLGRPTGWVGLSWVVSRFLAFRWVGLGRGSEIFRKILILGRPLVTAAVLPDHLILINTDE